MYNLYAINVYTSFHLYNMRLKFSISHKFQTVKSIIFLNNLIYRIDLSRLKFDEKILPRINLYFTRFAHFCHTGNSGYWPKQFPRRINEKTYAQINSRT